MRWRCKTFWISTRWLVAQCRFFHKDQVPWLHANKKIELMSKNCVDMEGTWPLNFLWAFGPTASTSAFRYECPRMENQSHSLCICLSLRSFPFNSLLFHEDIPETCLWITQGTTPFLLFFASFVALFPEERLGFHEEQEGKKEIAGKRKRKTDWQGECTIDI